MVNEELLFRDDMMMTWMRDRFLQLLTSGRRKSSLPLKQAFDQLGLHPYFTYPAIAVLQPIGKRQDPHSQTEQLRQILEQQLPETAVVYIDEQDRAAILFSWSVRHLLPALQRTLAEQWQMDVAIGIGQPCRQLADVHRSCMQADAALQSRFYQGSARLLYASELKPYRSLADYPEQGEKELLAAIKASESEQELAEAVHRFYEPLLQEGRPDIKQIYELTMRLLIRTEKKLLADHGCGECHARTEVTAIPGMETLEELERYLVRCYLQIRKSPVSEAKENHRRIIQKTIRYMEQECDKATLCEVARKVYMTPTYLSLLFKTNTGHTFIEHLTQIRMEKAKELLRTTHYKNYEVAEQVGYQDPRYFSQVFKKKVGVSPTEFRDAVAN
ncbi:helix-turn-helix domain-containing protein [Paenibacillus sp. 1P07SE]|uniref:helix-turn-helix domain-containing protein n=1 Tax=Paenibacillus sp. 1P07SE TaxID=3132209 RepID=UPI0039A53D8F